MSYIYAFPLVNKIYLLAVTRDAHHLSVGVVPRRIVGEPVARSANFANLESLFSDR